MRHACSLLADRDRRSPLNIALERHGRIAEALAKAEANGFSVQRLRADLKAVEREIRLLGVVESG